ncbi:zinc-ribbon domain-containing protein [bacterium]|nr:zinc-ribbon domain-containing protein [bacterium]
MMKNHCSHCNNEDYWQLVKMTTWFSLFLIPLIPYENKYMLICPICEYGVKLNSDQFSEYKPIADANTELVKGNITPEEYHRRLNPGKAAQQNNVIEGETVKEKAKVKDSAKLIYCAHCGNKNFKEANFCKDCGKDII